MENASKALIMAGAVLIALLIISLGVMVFRGFSNTVEDNTSLDEEARSSFNSKIIRYLGDNISGSQVNDLIGLARTINQRAINNNNTSQCITITYTKNKESMKVENSKIVGTLSKVPTGSFYNVTGTYDESTGLITTITIE